MCKILAGTLEHLEHAGSSWAILDIGFASKKKSCGLLLPNMDKPDYFTYAAVRDCLVRSVREFKKPINLVIEAPLSVAFSSEGNPTGRKIEKPEDETRYWYVGPGCSTMVAALYLVRDIAATRAATQIRLFEAFVTFKPRSSDHCADVEAIQGVVRNPTRHTGCIILPKDLKANPTDKIMSAGCLCGIDFGVPMVIRP